MTKDLTALVCPTCKGEFSRNNPEQWVCTSCGYSIYLINGKPFFQQTPEDIRPFEKTERGPDSGTPWRRANWQFMQKQVNLLSPDAMILDVGAGRGDFADILEGRHSLAVDVIPFPEVDIICDLTRCIPFRESSMDAVVLMNVLEHVYDTKGLLKSIHKLLKPGGKLILTIPFLLKVHFSPYDFYRYTHHSLERILQEADFIVDSISGYYDPKFLMGEALRNITNWVLPEKKRIPRLVARIIISIIQVFMHLIGKITGEGMIKNPSIQKSPAAIGYLVVANKPDEQKS